MGIMIDPLRHHKGHQELQGAFGNDKFGAFAEKFARFMGTSKYLVSQTFFVILWMVFNGYLAAHALHGKGFDPYPWILLNLIFSTQASYAAPLILLAQTRQAARDKAAEEASAKHRQELADAQAAQLKVNTELTEQIHSMQTQQMNMLALLEENHHGRPGGNPGNDSKPDSGQRAAGPVSVSGVPGLDQPADAPGNPGRPGS